MARMSNSTPIDGFESSRHFQMWRYDVGHAQLLLRSVKDESNASRIDVLFKAVKTIDLPTSLDGLSLRRGSDGFLASGANWEGQVRADACFAAEDDGEYFDPSPFSGSFPGA